MLAGAPTGLYGHVEENRRRSILLFGGFLVAIQLFAVAGLTVWTLYFDQAHNPFLNPLGYASRYMLPVALVAALVYAVRFWWFVGGVRKAVGFRYVDGTDEPRFCRILEPLCITAGIGFPYAGVIESPALNAFACGIRANQMVVVATRGLINGLDDDELAAVLAHEVTHIKNRDTLLLASANTFMATLLLTQKMRQLRFDDWRQVTGLIMLPVLVPLYLFLFLLNQLALRIGYSSRAAIGSARELIADAEAVRLTKNPAALVSALRKIEGRSRIQGLGVAEEAMMIDGAAMGPLATHPAIADRIAALARTTGPMIFGGGAALDTRAGAAAGLSAAPGREGDDEELMRIAALSSAATGTSFWEIFRKVGEPGRNILGFNRRNAIGLLIIVIGVLVVAQLPQGARLFAAQRDIVSLSRDSGSMQRLLAACELEAVGITGVAGPCDKAALEARQRDLVIRMGYPDPVETEAAEARHRQATIDSIIAKRCFATMQDMTPAALTGPPEGKRFGKPPGYYRRAAEPSVESILAMPPGKARDRALMDYTDGRFLMLGNALYFNGREEFDALNAAYHREDHQRVVALLAERLKDPAFTAGMMSAQQIGELHILANAPFDALPCDVLPARG